MSSYLECYLRLCCLLCGLVLLDSVVATAAGGGKPDRDERPANVTAPRDPVRRQPIRIRAVGDQLLVANRTSGTLSVLATQAAARPSTRGSKRPSPVSLRVVHEWQVGQQLRDMAATRPVDSRSAPQLVVLDDQNNEVILLRQDAGDFRGGWRVTDRHQVAASPVAATWVSRSQIALSTNWAQQVWIFEVDSQSRLVETAVVDMPFAPGLLTEVAEENILLVADHAGPHLALIELSSGRLAHVWQISGHNIRGMAIDRKSGDVLLTHQMLSDFVPTTHRHVFWGNVLTNLLRSIPLKSLLAGPEPSDEAASLHQSSGKPPRKVHGSIFPLGEENNAAGDPGECRISAVGDQLVVIRGTHELAVRRQGRRRFSRLTVGQGPSSVATLPGNARLAAVANRFDDSISLVDISTENPTSCQTLKLAHSPYQSQLVQSQQTPQPQAVQGERLFYDATQSLDGWFSCHSCHTDGHTCGLTNDNFGDASMGAAKLIPSLLGTADTAPWGWLGNESSLASQIRKSLQLTMRHPEFQTRKKRGDQRVVALTAYLKSLPAPPSRAAARQRAGQTQSVAPAQRDAGARRFNQLGCADCHAQPTGTSRGTYDVGLVDANGIQQFNPPSLRGISQRFRFLHDGSKRSLDAVLTVHPPDVSLSDEDRRLLSSYLQGL